MTKYRLKDNVLEAARKRISWIFDEFETVVVNTSGGKDSTVILELALDEARKRDRLPLPVLWVDQEAEFQATVDYVREVMYRPEVKPYWVQVPIRLFNATSFTSHWLDCWDPEQEHLWIHPKDPIGIHENRYGTDRFVPIFDKIADVEFPDGPACFLTGMRCEESPTRAAGMTGQPCWKHVTWGKRHKRRKDFVTLGPLYDWSYTDIWKAIHEFGWNYNTIYDQQYKYGINPKKMRVSNLHHELAIHQLFYLQETEGKTYERLCARLPGIHAACQAGEEGYFIKELPFMFATWREYRDYLMEKLLTPDYRKSMKRHFDYMDHHIDWEPEEKRARKQVQSILTNDHEGVKVYQYVTTQKYLRYKAVGKGNIRDADLKKQQPSE